MNETLDPKRVATGEAIHRLRVERKLSLADVASHIGVSRALVSLWESGKSTPSVDKAWMLADYFGVPVAEVIGKVEIEVTTREIIAAPATSKED